MTEASQEPRRHNEAVYRVKSGPITAAIGGILLLPYAMYAFIYVVRADALGLAAFVVIVTVPILTFFARAGLAAVVTTDRGVRVRNIRGTTCVPWEEVDRFSVGAQGMLTKVGLLERRNRKPIAMWAIQGPNP